MLTCFQAWAIYCHLFYASKHVSVYPILSCTYPVRAFARRTVLSNHCIRPKRLSHQPKATMKNWLKKTHCLWSSRRWTLLAGYVGTELPWFWSNLHASADRIAQKISENIYFKSQQGNVWGPGKTPLVRKKHFQLSRWNISTVSINIHQSILDFGGFLNLQWRWVIASSDLPVKHDGPWGQS